MLFSDTVDMLARAQSLRRNAFGWQQHVKYAMTTMLPPSSVNHADPDILLNTRCLVQVPYAVTDPAHTSISYTKAG